jgi:hypothetical protein
MDICSCNGVSLSSDLINEVIADILENVRPSLKRGEKSDLSRIDVLNVSRGHNDPITRANVHSLET